MLASLKLFYCESYHRVLSNYEVSENDLGRSQDFSKGGGGGSHCVKQRVLAFLQPEYCRLFE